MAYTVRSSEKTRQKASETETKALLYLMNFHENSKEMHYFVVDFFNDLTGMDRLSRKLWDVQSKGATNSSPKKIGRELVTLFKNYCSNFTFDGYILFLSDVPYTFRIDSTRNVFDINNLQDNSIKQLKAGFIEECTKKTYINKTKMTVKNIDGFLKKILFVIDDKEPSEYVKAIIKIHPKIIPEESTLNGIFNEIRDKQASKKNVKAEEITIATPDQALDYCRHMTAGEIKLFVLGRIINRNPFDKGCPAPFISIFNKFPNEKKQETLDECKIALSRALFNKNCADNFWNMFSNIYSTIVNNPSADVEKIFTLLDEKITNDCPDFDVLSLKYFIATVKEGISA